ncbi:histidine phosphatase family protein [Candidatus Pacearchaeota archaeon]|nr:histidine phosphatase family protein [Candidatus Pacearchaeota archaeon]
MRLIITRHGETVENRAGIIQGHLPGVLSDLGREQAQRLAKKLKDEKIDLIISSDLARAVDTTREVARFHDCEILFDERLRERYLGSFQGKREKEDLGIGKDKLIADVIKGDDVETHEEILARAKDLLNYILTLDFENILLVGHSGICKNILRHVMNCEHKDIPNLGNTSISIFEIDEDKNFNEILLNCVRHLDENSEI